MFKNNMEHLIKENCFNVKMSTILHNYHFFGIVFLFYFVIFVSRPS